MSSLAIIFRDSNTEDDDDDDVFYNFDTFLDSIPASSNYKNQFEHIDSLPKRFVQCEDT
ncbi:unnamed protein product, partial [Rotaria sordida]